MKGENDSRMMTELRAARMEVRGMPLSSSTSSERHVMSLEGSRRGNHFKG